MGHTDLEFSMVSLFSNIPFRFSLSSPLIPPEIPANKVNTVSIN